MTKSELFPKKIAAGAGMVFGDLPLYPSGISRKVFVEQGE
jgi:hypothetical protein